MLLVVLDILGLVMEHQDLAEGNLVESGKPTEKEGVNRGNLVEKERVNRGNHAEKEVKNANFNLSIL